MHLDFRTCFEERGNLICQNIAELRSQVCYEVDLDKRWIATQQIGLVHDKLFESRTLDLVRDAGNILDRDQSLPSLFSTLLFEPLIEICLLYTSPSPRDLSTSRMPSSA